MKRTIASHWFVVLVLSGTLTAQDERAREAVWPASLFAVFDRNADGKISREEIDLAVSSLRVLDRDRDGILSQAELRAVRGAGQGRPPEGRLPAASPPWEEFDRDGDGKVSLKEAPDRMKERFDRLDRNGDGFIDKNEQERAGRLFREMRERGARFPGGEGRPPDVDGPPLGRGGGARGSREEVWKVLAGKYDRDGSGTISAEEYPRGEERFAMLDRNEDGQLSIDDFRGQREVRRGGRRGAGEAPQKGEAAPDFELSYARKEGEAGNEGSVKLSSFQGKKPVALIFGSYT